MEHLTNINIAPAGGWRYVQPETGWTGTAVTFQSLVSMVATHRLNNKIPTEGRLEDAIMDSICSSLSHQDQVANCQPGVRKRTVVGWREVEAFLNVATAWLKAGSELVTQEEAERRAAICVGCPLNVGMGGCAPCRVAIRELRTRVLDRHTTQDEKLQSCGVCGCDNRAQVHVPLAVLRTAQRPEHTYPTFCWKSPDFKNG